MGRPKLDLSEFIDSNVDLFMYLIEYQPVPGVQIVERGGKWGAGESERTRSLPLSPSSLPSFFFSSEISLPRSTI